MIGSSDPLVRGTLECLLEARQHCQELPLFSRPMRTSRQTGRQYSRLRGRGVDFDQVRAYQPGDDIRSIDWRVTARTQKVHTKVFNEERERPVFVICEQSERLFLGTQRSFKSVLAAEACALIAWTALAHNDRVGGMIFDREQCHEVRPRRNRQAILQLFRLLMDANHQLAAGREAPVDAHSEPLNLALRHSREIIRPGSIIYLLCDHAAIDHLNQALLVPLSAHNDLILLPVLDPLDRDLPQKGLLDFTQGGRTLRLDTSQPAIVDAYRAQFDAQAGAWQHLATRLRCGLNTLDTSLPAVDQLRSMLGHAPRPASP
jgi:uncharacterized protein (DUF58 family)